MTVVFSIAVQTVGAFCYPSTWNRLPVTVDLNHDRLWNSARFGALALFDRIVQTAGSLNHGFQVGCGWPRKHVYIDNAAEAHLIAADRLEPGSLIAGRTYFVTQGETFLLWDMINHFLKAAGLAPVTLRVSSRPLAIASRGISWNWPTIYHGEQMTKKHHKTSALRINRPRRCQKGPRLARVVGLGLPLVVRLPDQRTRSGN